MIFPLAAAVPTIVLDGSVLRSYNAPYIERGRIMAPLDPFVTSIAAGIEYSGGVLIVRRADRFAQIPMAQPYPSHFQSTYVPIAPILRSLGVQFSYDAAAHVLLVRTPPAVLATPTPFNPAVPQAAPRIVFTPTPVQTARPIVTGTPAPRRTPLPFSSPVPKCPHGCDRHPTRRGA